MKTSRPLLLALSLALACDPPPSPGANPAIDHGGNCATCHMPEYTQVTDPVHVEKKPTTCGVCHGQEAWRPSTVTHPFWALTGAHQGADCLYCHGHKGAPPTFKGTPKDCVACHGPEYNSSTFPNHATFPTKCADCHTTKAFRPATFTPPPVVAALGVPGAPGGRPLPPLVKLGPGQKSSPLLARPGAAVPATPPPPPPPPLPRAPTRPPDVISRPSPRR